MALDLFCVHCQRRVTFPETVLAPGARCPLCRQVVVSAVEIAGEGKSALRPVRQLVLRIVVLLCALAGAAVSVFLGYTWRSQQAELGDQMELLRLFQKADPGVAAGLADFEGKTRVFPLLFVAAGLGIVGGVLAFARLGASAGPLLLASVIGPAILFPKSLIFTAFLAIAGLLSFLIQTKRAALESALRARQQDEEPLVPRKIVYAAASLGGLALLGYAGFLGFVLMSAAKSQSPPARSLGSNATH